MFSSPSPAFSVQDFIELYSPMGYSHTLIRKFYEQHLYSPYIEDKILESLLASKYASYLQFANKPLNNRNQSDQISSSPSVFPKMSSCLKRLKTSANHYRSKQDLERPQKHDREDLNPEKITRYSPKDHIGFQNEQNLCTLNSILQILLPIKPFLQAILKFRTPATGSVSKKTNASFTLISKLQELFASVLYGNRLELNTSEIASNIPYPNGELLKPGDQADVEEIFTLLKEAIEDGLLSSCLKDISVYQTLPPEISDFKNLLNGSSQDSTEIIFQNGNRNEKNSHSQRSELSVINLNVTQKGFLPVLRAALTSITDDYKDKTGHLATMKKRTWILEPPKILTFRPQRAFFDPNEGVVRSDDEFDFPLEFYLDEFLAKNREKVKGIEESIMENQQHLQIRQKYRNHLIQAYQCLEDEIQLISRSQTSNSDVQNIKKSMITHKDSIQGCETKIMNLQKDQKTLQAKSMKIFSEMKEVKYKLQGVVMHEGSADLGHYYALTYNHNTTRWTKFNDTKIRELSHEEGYNFVRGIVTQTEPKGKYAIESKPCAYLIFYVRENCELLDWNRATLEKLKTTISPNILHSVDVCNQKFERECRDFNERPYLIERVYSDYLKKINELSTPNSTQYNTNPIPEIGSFKDFLLMDKANCSELLNYIILKEIIQNIHIPYQILEGETENYYFKELERFITAKNSESPLKSLHLSQKNQNLLIDKQEEFKILTECKIISEKILQCALESNFSGALITTIFLHQNLQNLKKTGYNVQFYEFANWIFRVLALKMAERISNLISSNHHDQDAKNQAKDLLEVLVDCLNKTEITKLRQAFSSEIKHILGQNLNRLWSIYERDPIFHQMLSHIDKIGSQTALLSQTQFESFIPQDLDQNLMINEISPDSFFFQLYEKFKANLQDVIEIEKNLSLTENQYKSSQFHPTSNSYRNGQENLAPTNYQSTYSSSFSSHSKINNKPPPQEHFVNINQYRKY